MILIWFATVTYITPGNVDAWMDELVHARSFEPRDQGSVTVFCLSASHDVPTWQTCLACMSR